MISPRHAAMGPDTGPADRARRDAAPVRSPARCSASIRRACIEICRRASLNTSGASASASVGSHGCLLVLNTRTFAPASGLDLAAGRGFFWMLSRPAVCKTAVKKPAGRRQVERYHQHPPAFSRRDKEWLRNTWDDQ